MGYYIGEGVILAPILSIFSWSDKIYAFLLSTNVSAWQNVLPNNDGSIATIGGISDMGHAFIILTVYIAALTLAAVALFMRRDIAGAKGG